MKAHTKETQAAMTPELSLQALKDGNQRFINATQVVRDLNAQVDATSNGQYPFATVLHCIDSRVSAEHVFDQGIGDLFSIRIAGNFVNEDILGSMEFACKLAGTKVLVVLGHTACGAVKGACDHARMGNLTALINKIEPAVDAVELPENESMRNSSNIDFVNSVAAKNVEMTLNDIRNKSEILKEMEVNGDLIIIGGMYNIANGKVIFNGSINLCVNAAYF
jgi:carbonic anhydrase